MEETKDWVEEAIQREALPKSLREGSDIDFCQKYSIPASTYYYTLSKQETSKKILDLVIARAKKSAPEILDKLVEKAMDGDMKAIDTYTESILQLAKILDVQSKGDKILVMPNQLIDKNATNGSTGNNS